MKFNARSYYTSTSKYLKIIKNLDPKWEMHIINESNAFFFSTSNNLKMEMCKKIFPVVTLKEETQAKGMFKKKDPQSNICTNRDKN